MACSASSLCTSLMKAHRYLVAMPDGVSCRNTTKKIACGVFRTFDWATGSSVCCKLMIYAYNEAGSRVCRTLRMLENGLLIAKKAPCCISNHSPDLARSDVGFEK